MPRQGICPTLYWDPSSDARFFFQRDFRLRVWGENLRGKQAAVPVLVQSLSVCIEIMLLRGFQLKVWKVDRQRFLNNLEMIENLIARIHGKTQSLHYMRRKPF